MLFVFIFAVPVEAWRLMLALKSGLIAESTWALDTLSILLFDDNTVTYFSLHHLPGLLEVLLEHFRRCLIQIFDICDELEIGFEKRKQLQESKEEEEEDRENGANDMPDISNQNLPNYTWVTRQGKSVKLDDKSKHLEHDMFDKKRWDVYSGFESGKALWESGKGDVTAHIHTCFEHPGSRSFMRKQFFGKCKNNNVKEKGKDKEKEENVENEKAKEENLETEEGNNNELDISDSKESHKEEEKENVTTNCMPKLEIKSEPPELELERTEKDTEKDMETDPSPTKVKEEKEEKEDGKVCEKNSEDEKLAEKCNESNCDSVTGSVRKRRFSSDLEDESYSKDDGPFNSLTEAQEELAKRCVCISNIFRSLSFVPGNDREISNHKGLMHVLGRLLLLHHKHLPRKQVVTSKEFDVDEKVMCRDLPEGDENDEWWWNCLTELRENTLVIFANIAGQLNLSKFSEDICRPIVDGLLHWVVCSSSSAQDPLPTMSPLSVLSPERLCLETLSKLCIHECNVDLILATPPYSRIVSFFSKMVIYLADKKQQVLREFAIVIMAYLVQGDSSASRALALQHPCISLLIDFIETAEAQALTIVSTHGVNMLKDNPEMMGTSLDMLRRAATILLNIAMVPENRLLFLHHQERLLSLVMSQILDQQVAQIIADILYQCSLADPSLPKPSAEDDKRATPTPPPPTLPNTTTTATTAAAAVKQES